MNVSAARELGENAEEVGRVVAKILEFEIMDRAWLQIIRNHPDLQLDADGQPLPLDPSYRINQKTRRQQNVSIDHPVSDIITLNEVIVTADADGNLAALDSCNFEQLTSLNLFQMHVHRHEVEAQEETPSLLSPVSHLRFLGSAVYKPPQSATGTNAAAASEIAHDTIPASETRCHSRCVVCNVVLREPMHPDDEPTDKKKAPKKGAPSPVTRQLFYRVLVVDLCCTLSEETEHGIRFGWNVVHEILYDCSYDWEKWSNSLEMSRLLLGGDFAVDLSVNGRIMTVIHPALKGGCTVLYLDPESSTPIAASQNSRALDDKDTAEDCDLAGHENSVESKINEQLEEVQAMVLAKPQNVADLPWSCTELGGCSISKGNVIPLPATNMNKLDAVANATSAVGISDGDAVCLDTSVSDNQSSIVEEFHNLALIVFLRQGLRWMVFGFRVKSEDSLRKAAAESNDKKSAPKKGAVTIDPPPVKLADLYLIAQWSISASVTSFAFDKPQRSLMSLGLQDGTVSLWNLSTLQLVDIIGKHQGPVTCLSIYRDINVPNQSVHIASGSLDGTLCWYGCSGSSSDALIVAKRGLCRSEELFHVELHGFRKDVRDAAVLNIQHYDSGSHDTPLLMVQYSSGAVVVYEWKSGFLLSRLEKKERQDFQDIVSSFNTFYSLPSFEDPAKRIIRLQREAEEAAAVEIARLEAEEAAAAEAARLEAETLANPAVTQVTDLQNGTEDAVPVLGEESSANHLANDESEEVVMKESVTEESIDHIPYKFILHSFKDGLRSDWSGYRSIGACTSDHFVHFAMIGDASYLALFTYDSLLKHLPPIVSHSSTSTLLGSHRLQPVSSTTITNKQGKSGRQVEEYNKGRKSTSREQPPDKQLRLTEERLHELEHSFLSPHERRHRNSDSTTRTSQQRQQVVAQPTASGPSLYEEFKKTARDPRLLTQTEVLRSKNEREARKTRYKTTALELGSLLQ